MYFEIPIVGLELTITPKAQLTYCNPNSGLEDMDRQLTPPRLKFFKHVISLLSVKDLITSVLHGNTIMKNERHHFH